MDLWTARIPGKFLQLFEPRAAPLEEIVVRPAIGAGAIAALGLGMFHQRLGLEILVAVGHEPAINLNASRLGGRRPLRLRRVWRGRRRWQRIKRGLYGRRLQELEVRARRH